MDVPLLTDVSQSEQLRHTLSDEYKNAIDALVRKITPDAVTGQVEMTDIVQYISTHTDDPDVVNFLSQSKDTNKNLKEDRKRAVADFNIDNLLVQPGSIWLITLSFAGMSNEERADANWPGSDSDEVTSSLPEDGEPVQIFQMFCLIKDGEVEDESGDSRHVEEFIGLPTSQQVEDFIKTSMAMPIPGYQPCIPATLAFSYNLNVHKRALQPFLRTFPIYCNIMFETADIRERMAEKDYAKVAARYREYIDAATKTKDAGNKAYAAKDRSIAVAHYEDAIEQLDKLLQRKISEEEERDKETRTLLAICLANCSAARMLDVPEGSSDAKGAKGDAEKAIATDPTYAKGYVRLSRAYEALDDISGAEDALVQGLNQKELRDHFGLADGLISFQTAGQGFPDDKNEFEKLLQKILEGESESANRMKGLAGAYKKRVDEHKQKLGIV